MHFCPLIADITLSTEAGVIVVGLVGGLWAWSMVLVRAGLDDFRQRIRNLIVENNALRRQNEGLYEEIVSCRREIAELRNKFPGP